MPRTTVSTDVVTRALRRACRAPSLHNSQPWQWVAQDDTVQLFLDKDRILYSTDHSGREAVIGCGAVLDHFRVAMAAEGWTANVDRMPNPNNPLHLASVDFSPMELVTDGHLRRADAILRRRTDRLPSPNHPIGNPSSRDSAEPWSPMPWSSTRSQTIFDPIWLRPRLSPNRSASTTRRTIPN